MAVRRIVAAIDVVINGQRNLDRLAAGYLAMERAAVRVANAMTRTTASTTAAARVWNSYTSTVRTAASAFGTLVTQIEKGRENLDRHGRSTRGLTGNIMDLTKSMLLFSVLLPLVQLPQRAIESLSQFVKVGADWQDQMRVSNTLLRLNEEQFAAVNTQVQKMSIQYGVTTESMRDLFTTAASSVSAIKVNTAALNEMGQAAYDASVAFKLAESSARLAYATGTDATESTTTLIQTMATYGLEIEHVAEVSDSLFAITDVGTVRFNELEHVLPRVTAAMGPLIQRYDTAEDKMRVMNESFAAFAAMTQVMPAEQAATSFANIFKDIGQMTGKQRELVTSWERIRKTQGLGEEQSLDPTALLKGGPMQALVQLRKIFDLHGPMVSQYVQNQRRLGNAQDEEGLRVTGQMQLMQAYFEDMRAVRGFQLASPEQFQRAQSAYEAGRQGSVQQGVEQMDKSFKAAQGKFSAAWTAMQVELFKTVEQPMVAGINPITTMFTALLDNADFKNSNLFGKIRIIANSLMNSFTDYFRSGGRGQIQSVGRELGVFIGDSLTDFFRGGKDNVLVEAAGAFSEAFIEGIKQTLPDLLKAALTSSITRAVAEAVAIRYITKGKMPNALSYGLSAGIPGLAFASTQGGEGGGGGFPDLSGMVAPALGTAAVSLATIVAARRFGSKPIFGSTGIPSPYGGLRSPKDIMEAFQVWTGFRTGAARARGPIPAPTGVGGLLRNIGKGGMIGAGLQAAQVLPELFSDEAERDKWGAVGSTVGGIGGGILGGAAGAAISGGLLSLVLGIGGSAFGGGLGRMAGTGLYDLTHPATGRGGGGVASAEDIGAPERVAIADIFATGMDNSQLPIIMTQIRDLLIHSGAGTVGGLAIPPTAGAPAPGPVPTGPAVTGALAGAFTSQLNDPELTPQQAQAACGPAAAAFFAKAYGRNPTLGEAYSLVTQIQGGDPASVGGTRGVNVLGTALSKMGVGNEVYTGKNVDWGRLADNAQAGIPGIVNIGPKGNFPGHFFQVGGYDATTNRFNVGVSGSVLSKYGGKDWMTPEEMLAMGPAFGAVYGKGGTATGAGGISEADIAAMQGGAATGAGPGGGGAGSVVINIQSLMTVEHMDGNTDVRALMGQMADMLRQLSTGGSVVGQVGTVSPS
jgi:hypothetical protein